MAPYLINQITALITALIIIIGTFILFKKRKKVVEIENKIAQEKLQIVKYQLEAKRIVVSEIKKMIHDVSGEIAEYLIQDPRWLDRFMDETGVTYRASVYGSRISHFFYEKRLLAKEAINYLEDTYKDEDTGLCLLIDSGTTMHPVFQEIAKRLHSAEKNFWQKKVCIITNNLPGVQYLMKYAKKDLYNNYSEMVIDCFLIPGKPLSVYSAITGAESEKWLNNIHQFLDHWRKIKELSKVKTINFLTGNYICRKIDDKGITINFFPVARGYGHVEIKNKMVKVSDSIYLLTPLMKISFATCQLLNKVNQFNIERNSEEALIIPQKVAYEEIQIPDGKDYHIFTTERVEGNHFYNFSKILKAKLNDLKVVIKAHIYELDISKCIPQSYNTKDHEIAMEIPHKSLRDAYYNRHETDKETDKIDIWDWDSVIDHENITNKVRL